MWSWDCLAKEERLRSYRTAWASRPGYFATPEEILRPPQHDTRTPQRDTRAGETSQPGVRKRARQHTDPLVPAVAEPVARRQPVGITKAARNNKKISDILVRALATEGISLMAALRSPPRSNKRSN